MTSFIVSMISIGLVVLSTGAVLGQEYPNKPLRIITVEVGGGTDFVARLIAQGLSGPLGQQVIVDNRTAVIASETLAKAQPDGYTTLVSSGTLWLMPFMQNVSYDPVRDFSPITLATRSPNILVLHPSVSAKTVKDLIALAKNRPGEFNYGSGPTGSSPHLAAELFKAMAGVELVRIPYKGSGLALNAVISGEVQLSFPPAPSVGPHVKSGRLTALAVTSAQPSMLAPGLPTVTASGLPGYESVSIVSMSAPAKTPESIVNRLNQEVGRVLARADMKEKFFNAGVEIVSSSPGELAATIKSEMSRMGKVIKDAGIRAE